MRILCPGQPRGQEIEPKTKTGLQDAPLGLVPPKGILTEQTAA